MDKERIIIGADIVPTPVNISLFENGDVAELVGADLIDYYGEDSFVICNLETPLADKATPIIKCGPNFLTSTKAVNGLKNINLISLANNHIKDQGSVGIISTCNALCEADIDFLGVGKNAQEAWKPYYFMFQGKKIGVYSCAEHEFSVATDSDYGANAFDPLVSLDQISEMQNSCDYIIVLYHGGKEYYRYPSPYLQKVCRRIVDKGANLVICQHSHCIGSKETYKNSIIVYGQGNYIFNKKKNEFWNQSLLIVINNKFEIEYIPIVQTEIGTRKANVEEADIILAEFLKRSEEITMPGFIEAKYREFSKRTIDDYVAVFHGKEHRILYILNKVTKGWYHRALSKRKYSKRQLAILQNYIGCEAHRELLLKGITDRIKSTN